MYEDISSPDGLIGIRKNCGLTQQGMAAKLGMSIRAYQGLEAGESAVRLIHILAAERVALAVAVTDKRFDICPASVRRDALDLAALIRGGD